MSNGNALAIAADNGIATNVQNVLDARRKVGDILTRVKNEFRGVVIDRAKEVAAVTDPKTFNVDAFVTPWLQQSERFKNQTVAFTSFRNELDNVIETYQHDNAPELIAALEARRNALQTELDKRNQTDATIAAQIVEINEFIAQLKGYGGYARPLTPLEELRVDIERRFEQTQRETSAELYEVLQATRERIEAELKQRIERDAYHEKEISRLKEELAGLRQQNQNAGPAQTNAQADTIEPTSTKKERTAGGKKSSKKRAGKKRSKKTT